jgi:hypothetical protein
MITQSAGLTFSLCSFFSFTVYMLIYSAETQLMQSFLPVLVELIAKTGVKEGLSRMANG